MMIFLVLIIAGFFAGAINSVAGGGILLTFPILLAAGISPLSSAITSIIIALPAAISAVYANRKDLATMPHKYYWLVVPCFFGGIVGYGLLANTPSDTFDQIIPWLILTAVLLFAFQPQLHNHLHRPPHVRLGSPLLLVAIGLFATSVYGGYFGAGFGFIMLALLSFTRIKTIFQMTALKNVAVTVICGTGTIYFSFVGGIAWEYGLTAAVGSAVGGYFGARFAHKISPHSIRIVILGIGLSVAAYAFVEL